MPTRYSQEVIEKARGLYIKYGGTNLDAIQREMRKQYPRWSKVNLLQRTEKVYKGRAAREKLGWIEEYGFEESLRLHLQELAASGNNDEQDLYLGIKAKRKEMQRISAGPKATRDQIYQYRDFCKLEIEARKNRDLSRDNLETFVAGYEKLLLWLGEMDSTAAKMLVKHGDRLAEMAQAHYGKTETEFDGASNRADESGDEPFSLLDRD